MQEQLDYARELIKAKRFYEARQILINIDHPKARSWLETIDALAPESSSSSSSQNWQGATYASQSADNPDVSKARLLQASDLIKAQKYDEARRILETLDHPKAREWLDRLNSMSPPAPAASSSITSSNLSASTYSPKIKTRKPLPDLDPKKPARSAGSNERMYASIIITVGILVVLAMVVVFGMHSTNVAISSTWKNLSPTTLLGFGGLFVVFIAVLIVRTKFRGTFLDSRLGFRLVMMGGAVGVFALVSVINQNISIPVNDGSISLSYPGTWTSEAPEQDADCQDDPDWRRCILVLYNTSQAKRVWLVLKEDSLDEDTTLAYEDDYQWSYVRDERSAELETQWDTTVGGMPATVREYTFMDDDHIRWYSARFIILRDPRHVIRLSFLSTNGDAVKALWTDVETIYKSVSFPNI